MNPFLFIFIFLGLLQGLTEFLPVSSSGHLVLVEQIPFIKNKLSQVQTDLNLFINIALHFSTLIAILFFLKKDLSLLIKNFFINLNSKNFKAKEIKIAFNIIWASFPAGIIGLGLHQFGSKLFSLPLLVFSLLIINGLALIFSKRIKTKSLQIDNLSPTKSFFIGLTQALAILPGISRSGLTITGGMLSGLEPLEAAKFSFYISIPAILGASLIELVKIDLTSFSFTFLVPLIFSMILTFLTGLIALKLLFYLVKKIRLDYFGYYTIFLGTLGLLFNFLKGATLN